MMLDNKRKNRKQNGRVHTHLAVALTLVAGIAVSLLAFGMASYWEEARLRKEFDIRADARIGLIENVVEDNMYALHSLADFYAASDKVERDEFRTFTMALLKDRPYILEFRWLARVRNAERAAFEESAGKDGLRDFEIKEVGKDGNIVRASEREEYFPSFYVEPIEKREHLLGLDSASFKERRAAIEKARDTGEAAAASEVAYIGSEEIKTASRVFYPIYRNGARTATVEDRRENLVGLITMIYNIKSLADLSREKLAPLGCDVYIYDECAQKGKKLLYFQPARLRDEIPEKPPFGESQLEEKGGFQFRRSSRMADCEWTLIGRPSPKFLKQNRTYFSFVILFAGVAVTVILAIYLSALLNRARIIEAVVEDRTAELRESEEKYKALYEYSSDAIMMLSPGGKFLAGNPATIKLFACKGEEEFTSKGPADLSPGRQPDGADSAAKAQQMVEVAREKGFHFFEWTHKKMSGEEFSATVLLTCLKIGGKDVLQATVRDITEIKKAEEKIREAAEIKSNFTSMVSHELRTPLASIKESIALVADGTTGSINKEQEEFLGMAKRNVDRLARLINDVLDFQKLEAGKVVFHMEEYDMNKVVDEVGTQMVSVAAGKGLGLKSDTEDGLPKANFDRDKIIQVLTNLVNNAIRFTEKGGITITTAKKENAIKVSVADTGIGIKKEDLPRLFHGFEQIASRKDRKTGGTGLGLVISKAIIDEHGGKIWAESTYGEGSTFHFILPIKERRHRHAQEDTDNRRRT